MNDFVSSLDGLIATLSIIICQTKTRFILSRYFCDVQIRARFKTRQYFCRFFSGASCLGEKVTFGEKKDRQKNCCHPFLDAALRCVGQSSQNQLNRIYVHEQSKHKVQRIYRSKEWIVQFVWGKGNNCPDVRMNCSKDTNPSSNATKQQRLNPFSCRVSPFPPQANERANCSENEKIGSIKIRSFRADRRTAEERTDGRERNNLMKIYSGDKIIRHVNIMLEGIEHLSNCAFVQVLSFYLFRDL